MSLYEYSMYSRLKFIADTLYEDGDPEKEEFMKNFSVHMAPPEPKPMVVGSAFYEAFNAAMKEHVDKHNEKAGTRLGLSQYMKLNRGTAIRTQITMEQNTESTPRRSRLDLMVPVEKAIVQTVFDIEKMGTDVRLTNAVTLLNTARNAIADFVDGVHHSEAESPGPFGVLHLGRGTFGQAIEALKQGKRICRSGWNGKGMFLFLLPAGTVPTKAIYDPALRAVIEQEVEGETFEALGSIRMFTADKKILTGWLASQTDMLAEDWMIL